MATAYGSYAVLSAVKSRLGIASADTTDDAIIQTICDQVNGYIESYTGTILAPIVGTQTQNYDGYDALSPRVLLLPKGVRSISRLQNGAYTGGPLYDIPSTDYFLRPNGLDLQPGFPYTELIMTNVPTAGNALPRFCPGLSNIVITGLFGWFDTPDEIHEVAEVMAVRAWAARQAGQQDMIGDPSMGGVHISRTLLNRDKETLNRYKLKKPDDIGVTRW
jgi:hypothetical protein